MAVVISAIPSCKDYDGKHFIKTQKRRLALMQAVRNNMGSNFDRVELSTN